VPEVHEVALCMLFKVRVFGLHGLWDGKYGSFDGNTALLTESRAMWREYGTL